MEPAELLLLIARSLPPESAAALCLTSRKILHKLAFNGPDLTSLIQNPNPTVRPGWMWLDDLPPLRVVINGPRQTFLLLLEKDDPNMILCYCCQELHHIAGPGVVWYKCMSWAETWLWSDGFNFNEIQKIMEMHRLGQPTNQRLGLLSQEWILPRRAHAIEGSYTSGCQTWKGMEARVGRGKFMVRTQQWILFASLESAPAGTNPYSYDGVYSHLQGNTEKAFMAVDVPFFREDFSIIVPTEDSLRTTIERRIHSHGMTAAPTQNLPQCPMCKAEYVVDSIDLKYCFAVVITTWHCMGEGITPLDVRFQMPFPTLTRHPDSLVRHYEATSTGTVLDNRPDELKNSLVVLKNAHERRLEWKKLAAELKRGPRGRGSRKEMKALRSEW